MNKEKNEKNVNKKEIKKCEVSIQTDDVENIYKNAKKVYLIRPKIDRFDSIVLSTISLKYFSLMEPSLR